MKRKLAITVIIFFSAFMLNVSAMGFQQRYDRREDDQEYDPFVIEMTDLQVFKYLRNTWYYDRPPDIEKNVLKSFYTDKLGFGQQYTVFSKPDLSSQLKFVLINYYGFYHRDLGEKTFLYKTGSG